MTRRRAVSYDETLMKENSKRPLIPETPKTQSGGVAPNYWDYLKLQGLLSSQGGLEEDEATLMPDELHFIVVHQVFELWFKLVLRELRLARDHLGAPKVPEEVVPYVVHHLHRVNEIMRHTVDQFRVVETLTPQDFLAFRDKLVPASGFQSFQMREIEIILGLDETQRRDTGLADPFDHIRRLVSTSPTGPEVWKKIEAAREEITLRSALHEWLYRTPIQGSSPSDFGDSDVVSRFIDAYLEACDKLGQDQLARYKSVAPDDPATLGGRLAQARQTAVSFLSAEDIDEGDRERIRRIRASLLFIESYRDLPLLAWPRLLVDTVVELEEQMVLWRNRHARMVERTIGLRVGTGGSSGVDYLDRTARYRVFPELWAVRAMLLPRTALPQLENPEFYGFA